MDYLEFDMMTTAALAVTALLTTVMIVKALGLANVVLRRAS